MAAKANTVNITSANTKLLGKGQLNALIEKAIKAAHSARGLLDMAALQCLLHAQKHGDVMPGARLLEGIRGSGFVVAAFNKWFQDHSPIRYTWNPETEKVEGKLLKEGEEGYTPFNTGAAEETPALATKEAKARANNPIREISIAYFAERIAQFKKQLKTAMVEGDRFKIVGNPDTIEAFLNVVEKAAINYRVEVVKAVGDTSTALGAALKEAQATGSNKRGRRVTGGQSSKTVSQTKAVKAA